MITEVAFLYYIYFLKFTFSVCDGVYSGMGSMCCFNRYVMNDISTRKKLFGNASFFIYFYTTLQLGIITIFKNYVK